MSCMVASSETLNCIVASIEHNFIEREFECYGRELAQKDADKLKTDLLRLNIHAWKIRYREVNNDSFRAEKQRYTGKRYSLVQCIKCCEFWLYQCAEDDDIMKTALYVQIRTHVDTLRKYFVQSLPEYKLAKWGL